MIVRAYAKLNLFLNVKGKLEDYHEVEFVNTQLELYDTLEFEEIDSGIVIECDDPDIPTDSNNFCYKAAELLQKDKGIKIMIKKGIPVSAGLGGGSVDTAATLLALNKLWGLNHSKEELIKLAAKISTDACYCIIGGTCIVKGKGEIIEKIDNIPQMDIIILRPNIKTPPKKTAWMYTNLKDYNQFSIDTFLSAKSIEQIAASISNSFHSVKVPEYIEVHKLLGKLKSHCLNAALAGSGPSIFGILKSGTDKQKLLQEFQQYNPIVTSTKTPKKISLAQEAGFCFGVKRALSIVNEQQDNIQILGNLIHNPQVVEELRQKGVEMVDELDQVTSKNLVITAHGIADSIKKNAVTKGFNVIDATCPLVDKVHQYAKQLEAEGYLVVVIGQPAHIEVIGITKDLKNYQIIQDIEDIKRINAKKIGIVVQTTQEVEKVENIVNQLRKIATDIKYYDTICHATKSRQKSAKEISAKADIMLVIGGYNSGNTRRLFDVCSKNTTAYHIETFRDIKPEWFDNATRIGITAGASTPKKLIDEVIDCVEQI